MFRKTLMIAAVSTLFCASAKEVVVKNGTTDWTKASSYVGETLPASGDVVVVATNDAVFVRDAASLAVLNTLDYVRTEPNASIAFSVPDGAVWTLDCEVTGGLDGKGNGLALGTIVKDGTGELRFNGAQTEFLLNNVCYDYYTSNLVVRAGKLTMKQGGMNREMYYGHVAAEEGATIEINTNGAPGGGNSNFVQFRTLSGRGTVTCSMNTQLRFGARTSFDGVFSGALAVYAQGPVTLNGTASTVTTTMRMDGGSWNNLDDETHVLGIRYFGTRGQSSSIGKSGNFLAQGSGGGFRYEGPGGESTDQYFSFSLDHSKDTELAFIDGGVNGGITFTADWYLWGGTSLAKAWVNRIALIGSNRNECVMSGNIPNCQYNGLVLPFNITKRGSGAWRFANNANRFSGGFAIDEGPLRFDNLEEAGIPSPLGMATRLLAPHIGAYDPSLEVGYAYRLGEENIKGQAKTEGVFEYVGTRGVAVGTRPFALKGDGRLLNGTSTTVRYSGVGSLTAGEHILTLDGTSMKTNEIVNVTNGVGTVSVVKEGSGTWQLGGESSFSGTLSVKGGTLLVDAPQANYTWFMMVVRKVPYAQLLNIGKIGLYDANGARLNGDLAAAVGDFSEVAPGQCTMRNHNTYNVTSPIEKALWTAHNNDNSLYMNRTSGGSAAYAEVDKPETWFRFLMHLTNTVETVASYDIFLRHGRYDNSANAGAADPGVSSSGQMNPQNYTIYGSTDGLNWDVLHHVEDNTSDDPVLNGGMPLPKNKGNWAYYWVSSSNSYVTADATCHHGYPIKGARTAKVSPALCNVSSVKVSNGGVLRANGANIAPVKGITADCTATSAGTIDCFAFAENGTLTVEGYDKSRGSHQELPVSIVNSVGPVDLSLWTVSVNGRTTAKTASVKNGKVCIDDPGLMLILR